MNALVNLQQQFSQSLLTQQSLIEAELTASGSDKLPSSLIIYQNAYRSRLLEALAKDYPVLQWLLGEDDFEVLALTYIEIHPSISFTLRYFGQHLSRFLSQQSTYRDRPFLSELATFEWQLVEAFDVADTPIADLAQMQHLEPQQWPTLRIKLHASVTWLPVLWNVDELHLAFRNQSNTPVTLHNNQPRTLLIWRKNDSPHYRVVDAIEAKALSILTQQSFAALCQYLADQSDQQEEAALSAATYLKSWLIAGLIETVICQE